MRSTRGFGGFLSRFLLKCTGLPPGDYYAKPRLRSRITKNKLKPLAAQPQIPVRAFVFHLRFRCNAFIRKLSLGPFLNSNAKFLRLKVEARRGFEELPEGVCRGVSTTCLRVWSIFCERGPLQEPFPESVSIVSWVACGQQL